MVAAAVVGAGVIGAGASLASGSMQADAAKSASNNQLTADREAAAQQLSMYNTTRGDLLPYNIQGQGALSQLGMLTGTNPGGNPLDSYLTKPFQPTMEQLAQTPGYQFSLDQGTKAAENSYAGAGLSRSGAGMKGAISFAEGLAGNTYQQQFSNDMATKLQIYNLLMGQSTQGANAAAMTGQLGTTAAGNAGNALIAGGNAAAAGTIGAANAWSNGLNGIAGSANNAAMTYAYGNRNGWFSGGGGGNSPESAANIA